MVSFSGRQILHSFFPKLKREFTTSICSVNIWLRPINLHGRGCITVDMALMGSVVYISLLMSGMHAAERAYVSDIGQSFGQV